MSNLEEFDDDADELDLETADRDDDDDTGDDDGIEGEGDDDDDDDTGDDDDNDDDTGDDDDDDDEGDDDDDEGGSGKGGAQKRIQQLVKRSKDAEAKLKAVQRELENAKRLSGDDGEAILSAAKATGILPGLMTSDEAKAFQALEQLPQLIEGYQDWLDEHSEGDSMGSGDDEMSYGQVRKHVRKLKARLESLKEDYGDRRKKAMSKVRKIMQLGLEAYRNGKGSKPAGKGGDDGKTSKRKKKVPPKRPKGVKPSGKAGKKKDWGSIGSTNDFVNAIMAQNEDE